MNLITLSILISVWFIVLTSLAYQLVNPNILAEGLFIDTYESRNYIIQKHIPFISLLGLITVLLILFGVL
ncbi:MAG: hypothetical protein ACRC1M_05820 [Methanobacteriaceae archaeon]